MISCSACSRLATERALEQLVEEPDRDDELVEVMLAALLGLLLLPALFPVGVVLEAIELLALLLLFVVEEVGEARRFCWSRCWC